MYAEAIALIAAACFGIAAVMLKKGYVYSTPIAANIVVLLVNVAVLWVFALVTVPLHLFFTTGAIFFGIGGILGQALARTLQYTGIEKVGPAHSHTVLGTTALFAAFFAMVFLDERWTLSMFIGTVLVIGGVALLAGEKNKGRWKKKHLLYPLSAAMAYGLVALIQKLGLEIVPHAIVGVTTATTAALIGMLLFAGVAGKLQKLTVKKALPFFVAAGIGNSAALFLYFEALRTGAVTVVFPLLATQALFTVVFSFFLLKGIEKITWNVVVGASVVVMGVVMITVF